VPREFFTDYRLSEPRLILQDMQGICITTDQPPFSDPQRRTDYLLYERNLVGLLEAAFILVRGDLPDIVARAFPTSCLLVMNRTQCFYTGSCKYLKISTPRAKIKGGVFSGTAGISYFVKKAL
jgi:hypothetical protein